MFEIFLEQLQQVNGILMLICCFAFLNESGQRGNLIDFSFT